MADKWPLANGNWSNAANWNGGTKPVSGDDVYADGKTVTIDENVNIGTGGIYNTQRTGGTSGGQFNLNNNLTITAGVISSASSGSYVFNNGTGCTVNCTSIFGWTSPGTGSVINGNVRGGASGSSRYGVNSSVGTLTINGNVFGGTGGVENVGISANSGTIIINGNVTGGDNSTGGNTSGSFQPYGILHAQNAAVTITINGNIQTGGVGGVRLASTQSGITVTLTVNGNVTAGIIASDNHGITVVSATPTTNITITGNATGSSGDGVQFRGLGTCIIQGNATAGSGGYGASNNTVGGTLRVYGCAIGNNFGLGGDSTGYAGVLGTGTSAGGVDTTTTVRAMKSGAKGQAAIAGRVFLDTADLANSFAKFRTGPSSFTEYTFGPAENIGGQPTESDVRSGVVYNFGARTGTCAVPGASSVAAGVPVGNTTGTAVITQSQLDASIATVSAKLPSALEGGRMAAALSSTVLTELFADADVTDLVNQIAAKFDAVDDLPIATIASAVRDAILNRILAGNHDTPGSVGKGLQDTLIQATSAASSASSASSSAATAATQASSAASSAATAATQSSAANAKLTTERLALIDGVAQKGTGSNTLATIADLINNLETGGLTPEQEEQLQTVSDTVNAISAALAGAPVQPTGRIASGGAIVAYIGDDFRVRSGTQLSIPVADPSGGLYTKLNAIGVENLAFGASRPDKAAGAITGTVASLATSGSGASQLLLITVEITNCGSGLKPGDDYTYQIEQRQTQGTEVDSFVEIEGALDLRKKNV